MKKITSICALACFSMYGYAQTQRTELYEIFNSENSAQSASVAPALQSLLNSNSSKILTINYEAALPTGSTLYNQDRRDISSRTGYYGAPFAPYARFDGYEFRNAPDTTKNGLASLLTQHIIDTTYADINAPFTITLSHTFHPAYDTAVVTMKITATEAFTAIGNLTAQLVMEEAAIHLSTPSGTNGQKDFYNVCRSMIPGASATTSPGTALPTTWTLGQTQTLTIIARIPGTIYDKNQICFVGFIQDDGNVHVKQAAYSAPQLILNDAQATALTGVPPFLCGVNYISATVTIKNTGADTLKASSIKYQLDATTVLTDYWTGALAPGASMNVTLPNITITPGTHVLNVWPAYPNGVADINTNYDTQTVNFILEGTGATAPLIQPFNPGGGPGAFPPAGWLVINPDNDVTWSQSNTIGDLAAGSARMRFPRSAPGHVDYLYTQNVDLSAAPTATLTFNLAHAQARTEADSLIIMGSTDCGQTWTTVYAKGGAALATAPHDTTQTFAPADTSQWKTQFVNLPSFGGSNNVIICFKAVSAMGNNLYIDDVNISNSPMGIQENELASSMQVFPNPFSDITTVRFSLKQAQKLKLEVFNLCGQYVYALNETNGITGINSIQFNGSDLAPGMYFIRITGDHSQFTQKINIQH
ncbi:MAG: T9SS type A sorting domain-containing protein [Bacteroidia bacterium]